MRVRGTSLADVLTACASTLSVLLMIALGFEVAVRVEDWVRFRMPFLSPYRQQADLVVRDVNGMHARPGAKFRKWSINSVGTRGPEVSVSKPNGVLRVATIGASETFGLYESPDHEFPRQLERTLLERIVACSGAAQKVEVLNAAFPGMSLPTVIQDVERRLRRFGLDIIVYYPTPAQYLEPDIPQPSLPTDGTGTDLPRTYVLYPRMTRRVVDQVKLLTPDWLEVWIRRREVDRQIRSHPPNWRFASPPSGRLRLYESDLRQLVATIRSIGARPVLATHANAFPLNKAIDRRRLAQWEYFYPRATGPTILQFDAAAAEITRRVASDLHVPLVDLERILGGQPDKFVDFSHFTDESAEIAARAFASEVMTVVGACTTGASRPDDWPSSDVPATWRATYAVRSNSRSSIRVIRPPSRGPLPSCGWRSLTARSRAIQDIALNLRLALET